MTSTFDRRIRELSDEVGSGKLVMGVVVDQIYAQIQHENKRFKHDDGRSGYLSDPLMENVFSLMEKLAVNAVTENGSRLGVAAQDVAETMAGFVAKNAPKDSGRLSESASPYVNDDGQRVYERPAVAPRRIGPAPRGWEKRPPR